GRAMGGAAPRGRTGGSAGVGAANGGGGEVEVAVSDAGQGMASEDVRRVFEPFYTTKAPGRGIGLGLAIVDHIIRAHGGHIAVESAPGRGTTMRVRLPLES